jgi:ribosome-associated translation inhibitor RaiA
VIESNLAGQESEAAVSPIYFPYDISFADCEPSPATIAKVEEHLTKLQRYYDRITDAKVIIRIPHKHGGLRFFHIHLQLDVPGKRLAVSREPEANDDHTDIQTALKIAFEKLQHQLVEFARSRNGGSKARRFRTGSLVIPSIR